MSEPGSPTLVSPVRIGRQADGTVLDPPEADPGVGAPSSSRLSSADGGVSVDAKSQDSRSPRGRRSRRPRELSREDLLTVVGCAISGVTLSWLVFNVLLDGGQWFGYLFVGYVWFIVSYGAITADRLGGLVAADARHHPLPAAGHRHRHQRARGVVLAGSGPDSDADLVAEVIDGLSKSNGDNSATEAAVSRIRVAARR